jgi:carbon-monoxide dehydrogenase medium subunit
VEEAIVGQAPTEENFQAAATKATAGVEPLEDFYASSEFRRHLAQVWTARALMQAAERAVS